MERVIATLLVRDEEEIVKECIEHHLRNGVHGFIVTDNGSKDKTREIVANCSGVLHLVDEPEHNHNQAKWVTRMARMAVDCGATWVVHIDADEFWYGLNNLQSVERWKGVGTITIENELCHVPVSGLVYGTFTRSQMPYYYEVRKPMPKVIHRANAKASVSHGNHFARHVPGRHVNRSCFAIHHYPIRSYEQFERKAIKGGTALKKHPGPWSNGKRWRIWYKTFKSGELPALYAEKMYTDDMIQAAIADNKLFHWSDICQDQS